MKIPRSLLRTQLWRRRRHFGRESNASPGESHLNSFMAMVAGKRDSAPGPDGIPYAAYLASHGVGGRIAYLAYRHCLACGRMPDDAKGSLMVCLPKGDGVFSERGRRCHVPPCTRPLCRKTRPSTATVSS